MAIPAPEKTWQYDVNQQTFASGDKKTDNHSSLLLVKNSLIGFGTLPWTVIASSNSIVANASDNWTVVGDLVNATPPTAHSWIQLRQTGLGATTEVVLALDVTNSDGSFGPSLYMSGVGFTGGSITARPTATDEVTVKSGSSSWLGATASHTTFDTFVHVMQSTDGECTRVFVYSSIYGEQATGVLRQTGPGGLWIIDKMKNPRPSLTLPVVFVENHGNFGSGNPAGRYNVIFDAVSAYGRTATTEYTAWLSTQGFQGEALGRIATHNRVISDFSGEVPATKIGIVSETPGARGKKGDLFDIWFGNERIESGTTFPVGATRTHAKHGDLIVPWNGTRVLTERTP